MDSYRVLELSGSEDELALATAVLSEHDCLGLDESQNAPGVLAYFSPSTRLDRIVEELERRIPSLSCREGAPVPERDWLAEWKRELDGFPIGERYFVLPSWKPDVDTSRTVLRIEPEQAFGTGTHETTRLSVALLERHVGRDDRVVDVGAGTGILSMVAAHEGARSVLAIEPDEAAAACARANVARNRLSQTIAVECCDFESIAPLRADVIVANIVPSVLTRAVRHMKGTIILSGILENELDAFVAELPSDTAVRERRRCGEWTALVVERD